VAYNIRRGGGVILLLDLLCALKEFQAIKVCIVINNDLHIPFNLPKNIQFKVVRTGILTRFVTEFWLMLKIKPGDDLIFFGNLPPLFRLSGRVFVYLQNRFLVDVFPLTENKTSYKIRTFLLKLWFVNRVSNVDFFFVQTPSMKKLLSSLKVTAPILEFPFFGGSKKLLTTTSTPTINPNKKKLHTGFHFIYVASGEEHKNHLNLLLAWNVLATEGIYPTLHLTLNEKYDSDLLSMVNYDKDLSSLFIVNHSEYSHDSIIKLYKKSDALIYPSFCESLGLPLVEASELGVPVIASELDYVRDLIDPEITFNPQSALSIAKAVKRFMSINDRKSIIKTADEFLRYVINFDTRV